MLVLPKHRFFYYLIGLFLLTPLTSCSSLFNKSSTTDIEDVDEAEEINEELQAITQKVFDYIAASNFDKSFASLLK